MEPFDYFLSYANERQHFRAEDHFPPHRAMVWCAESLECVVSFMSIHNGLGVAVSKATTEYHAILLSPPSIVLQPVAPYGILYPCTNP